MRPLPQLPRLALRSMSSLNNKKSIINSSRPARPRALTTLTPHLSEARGLAPDRISRPRSFSVQQPHQLSEKQQQAILQAVASSTTFPVPQHRPTVLPSEGYGDPSIDPRTINLTPADSASLPTADLLPSEIEQTPEALAAVHEVEEKPFHLTDFENQNMSAAAYMLPNAYGPTMDSYHSHYQSGYHSASSYPHDEAHSTAHSSPPASTYGTSYTTSPSLMSTSPRNPGHRSDSRSYHSAHPSPYLTPASPGQGYHPSPSQPLSYYTSQAQPVQSLAPSAYPPQYSLSHAPYVASSYDSHSDRYGHGGSSYAQSHGYVGSSSADMGSNATEDSSVRILNQRPKPQCWDHGCNGRQFSTFSNLLRHQREKSGTAAKSVCPRCGAEFTRTTARNGHMAHDKCKRKSSATASSVE